jgi:serine/threonine-protein phosphatase 5
VHGGLPEKADVTISDILAIDRFKVPENGSIMSQMLWSDPRNAMGISPSHRGEGVLFGPDITAAFLQRSNLQVIVRSHEWEMEGYKVDHNGQCVTIFSAPDYT